MVLCDFETSLVYRVSSRNARATERNLTLKKPKKKKIVKNCLNCPTPRPSGNGVFEKVNLG